MLSLRIPISRKQNIIRSSFLLTAIVLFCICTSYAQTRTDSLKQKLTTLPDLPDSTAKASLQKVDSITHQFNIQADSLKNQYTVSMAKIDAESQSLNHKIDSLNNLKLPANQYTQKLDSLNKVRHKTTEGFTSKLDKLKGKTTGKLNAVELTPGINDQVKKITQQVNGTDITSDFVKIPSLDAKGLQVPEIEGLNGLKDLTGKAGEIGKLGSLPTTEGAIPAVGNALPKVDTPLGDLKGVTDQAKGLQGDVKSITEGNLKDVKQLPETLESQASKIDGVADLQKQSGMVDEYKSKLDPLKNPEAGKEKVAEMAKEVAIDHFAGKQEQLKAAMDKIAKYKQKYSSVSSLKDLPKRPPNAMKGKPFVERFLPGIYLQYQQKNGHLIDVNPYASYKLSGRFTTGIGWNQRFVYNNVKNHWDPQKRIYGPRAFVDFGIGKGFIVHLETEMMNSFVPSTFLGNPDTGSRQWVWGMATGMKKEYKIYKNLKGTVLLQYNLFNPYFKSPYIDRLNSRIGFEYVLKKKVKKAP
jgi:hypothetical protein